MLDPPLLSPNSGQSSCSLADKSIDAVPKQKSHETSHVSNEAVAIIDMVLHLKAELDWPTF